MIYIKNNLKHNSLKLILLTLTSTIIYLLISIILKNNNTYTITDNLDYILPIIIIVIIHHNFKYKKIKEEIHHLIELPINTKTIFKYKYIISVIQLTIVYIVLLILTPILNKLLVLNIPTNIGVYTISLLIKYIFIYLLFNFFLIIYNNSKSLKRSYLNIIVSILLLSIVNIVVMSMTKYSGNFELIIGGLNIFSLLRVIFYDYLNSIQSVPFTEGVVFVTIIFSILSVISIPLNFILEKQIKYKKTH